MLECMNGQPCKLLPTTQFGPGQVMRWLQGDGGSGEGATHRHVTGTDLIPACMIPSKTLVFGYLIRGWVDRALGADQLGGRADLGQSGRPR